MSSVVNKLQTYFCTNGLRKLTSHPERAAFLFVILIKQLHPYAASLITISMKALYTILVYM